MQHKDNINTATARLLETVSYINAAYLFIVRVQDPTSSLNANIIANYELVPAVTLSDWT